VWDGGLSRLLADLVVHVHANKKLDDPYSFEEAREKKEWQDVMT
jgi:hypothetical protein